MLKCLLYCFLNVLFALSQFKILFIKTLFVNWNEGVLRENPTFATKELYFLKGKLINLNNLVELLCLFNRNAYIALA